MKLVHEFVLGGHCESECLRGRLEGLVRARKLCEMNRDQSIITAEKAIHK